MLVVNYVSKYLLISQAFLAQVDPNQKFLVKVTTGETKCLSTMKPFDKTENSKC